jgi:hypothetical protein
MIRLFRKHDNLYGGHQIRPFVVQFLDAEVAPVLRGASRESLGDNYLSAVAELTQLAGWLAYDALDHGVVFRTTKIVYIYQADVTLCA